MRVLYLKEKSRSGDRSYRGGVRREVAIGESWHLWRKSRSGDRSYRGGVRREVAIGGSWHQGEVAIGRSILQGRCQERVAIGESWHQGEVAIGRSLLQGRCQERESPLGASGGSRDRCSWHLWRSRDREIAPTGEVSGERVAIGGSWHQGEVAIGRSLLQGRCQERVAIGGSIRGKFGSILQGRCQERVAGEVGIYGEVAIGRSPTGEVSGESRHRGKLASGGSRDREIAPTGEVSGERSPSGEVGIYGEVAIGRSLLQKT